MSPKIKNIIIFVGIGLVLVVLYIALFNKKSEDENFIVSSTDEQLAAEAFSTALPNENSEIAQEFLAELLSVKSLQLDDSIFAGIVFASLKDPDVVIIQDEKEGRPNPFAPIGFGATQPVSTSVIPSNTTTTPTTTTTTSSTPTTTKPTTTTGGAVNPTNTGGSTTTPTTPTNTTTPATNTPVN